MQRKLHTKLFQDQLIPDQETYDQKLAEPMTPNHLKRSYAKLQSIHAKKSRMNKTYMHEMAARTADFTLWTESGEFLLEYLDYQAPAGLGELSQALSSNMWGSYLDKTKFNFYKSNQYIQISYIPPQYFSQICNKYFELQVQAFKTTRPTKPIIVSTLVTKTCYPVAKKGDRNRDNTGEWFYCAGHDGQPENWSNRDQNASENFPELQWIYRYNNKLTNQYQSSNTK